MFDYLNESLRSYLEKLAARVPCPGGGSVAALTASLSAALASMVANYTLGKKNYRQYEHLIAATLEKIKAIGQKLERFVEDDSRLYEKIQQATRQNSPALQEHLRLSAGLHLEISRECFSLLQEDLLLLEKGNRHLISDVGISAVLAEAAFRAACINAAINFKYIQDTAFVAAGQAELEDLKTKIFPLCSTIEQKVNQTLKGD
ncbi:MAG: cyclodeaminase/cyclohydrolase family protein [Candidatus Omnitrophica bacterium]|nr:cyclodeaminase/cyclohydrolase family protein [Candidatus Omnitrophota bacterium]